MKTNNRTSKIINSEVIISNQLISRLTWEKERSVTSTELYVYRPDGASQYYTVDPPIQINSGDVIGFDFVGGTSSGEYKRFLYFNEYNFSVDTGATGDVFRLISGSARLNGENVSSGNTKIPTEGIHSFNVTCLAAGTLSTLLSAYQEHLMNLPIFNFYVERGGVRLNEIPLNVKEQGATQLPLTGESSATVQNYLPDYWEKLSGNTLTTWYNTQTGLVYPNENISDNDEVIK